MESTELRFLYAFEFTQNRVKTLICVVSGTHATSLTSHVNMSGSELGDTLRCNCMMDDYLKVSFKELFAEDGLTIIGRGLGIQNLFSKFAQYYSSKECGRKLVFCLNCTGVEDQLHDLFISNAYPGVKNLPQVINNEVTAQDRIEKYMQGGCYIITSRILIVDLLDNKVDANSISGLLVYNAHRISETSVESFIIKVFRERNRLGFVKGFSEDPESLQSGFGKIERLMRVLYVKRLYLWPRFRLEIVEALKMSREPEVVELVTGLTPHMKSIQSAVLAAMNTCIQELKKAAPHLETSQMTLENGLFQAFDLAIKNQLDAEWHRTPPRTKQLVADIGVLRKLLDYLIRYDAFSFYYLLMKLQQASTDQPTPSPWLMSEAANQIFKKAKERVYQVQALPAAGASSKAPPKKDSRAEFVQRVARQYGLTTTMKSCGECPPKWKLATSVMTEIKNDYASKRAEPVDTTRSAAEQAKEWFLHQSTAGRVLFIVKDSMAQAQLRDVLVAGLTRVCDERYRWFVSQQAVEIRSRLRKQNLQQQQSQRRGAGVKRPNPSAAGVPGGSSEQAAKAARTEDGSRNAFLYPSDSDLLSSAASEAEAAEDSAALEFGIPDSWFASLPVESKLILIEERALRIPVVPAGALDSRALAAPASSKAPAQPSSVRTAAPQRAASFAGSQASSGTSGDDSPCTASVLDPDLHVVIMTHSEAKENFTTLHDCCPAYVVLYDPDITIIRTIETYQSMQPAEAPPVKVYFLLYEGSGEEHRYAGALFKEKKAFESLIAAKEHMVISLPDHPADVLQEVQSDKLLLSMDTRTMQKGAQSRGPRSIVVDVRDFRCTLPSVLYGSGKFAVVPRTLQVGDYVLSPEICVERKGISDLFQSFASGRLYNQAESMFRHYKHPCLLIEFSQDKAFCLLAANEMSPDILQHSITSRLCLLALSFPNLRILWSRSAACSVEIFRSLVTNHEAVDVEKAVAAGSEGDSAASANEARGLPGGASAATGTEEDATGDGDGEGESAPAGYYDDVQRPVRKISATVSGAVTTRPAAAVVADESARASAREMLLSLPGINVHNFRDVMNSVTNLAELSAMSVEQLEPLIGPVNAKKLYSFFGQSC